MLRWIPSGNGMSLSQWCMVMVMVMVMVIMCSS